MKKSKTIVLTLIASVCVMASGCSSEQKTLRDLYASKEDCDNDWGSNECEPDQGGTGYRSPHYYFSNGRSYYYPRGSAEPVAIHPAQGAFRTIKPGLHPPRAVGSLTATKTIRGGFGGSSFFHGGGS